MRRMDMAHMGGDGRERLGCTEAGRAEDGDGLFEFLNHDADRLYQIGIV